jgi:imidazole glycerol-phosphate synthase subunit HisH
MKVALVDYGAGNLRSVSAALERGGVTPFATREPRAVLEAPLAVVAGVGHLASAVDGLAQDGTREAIRRRVARGRPLLGICVGMQLLFDESEEGGAGLGLLAGPVRRIRARRVPHMGWNTLAVRPGSPLLADLDGQDVYFAHSYAVEPTEDGVAVATVDHDGPVVAAVEQGPIAGVQFHPERSGAAGLAALENVIRWSRNA